MRRLGTVVVWPETVMNLNAANGSFWSGLPDNRYSVLPPKKNRLSAMC